MILEDMVTLFMLGNDHNMIGGVTALETEVIGCSGGSSLRPWWCDCHAARGRRAADIPDGAR